MKKDVIKITEEDLRSAIKESIIRFLQGPDEKEGQLRHLSLLTELGDVQASDGTDITQEYLYEDIDEGLIMSYDINKSASYLKSKFPNIIKIRSLRYNPYKRSDRPKKNDFVAIDLGTDYANYKEIIYTVKNLLGWFTSSITLRETVKKGFIPRIFNNFDGTFECDDLNGVSRYDGENGFENYLADHSVSAFSIIIEAKFGKRYAQKSGEVLYHATDSSHLKRIREQGLIPRSLGNFPDRIYLGSDIHEIENMVGPNLQDMWFLKINVDGLEIYHDERERTAYYTYDNISPDRILEIFQIQS